MDLRKRDGAIKNSLRFVFACLLFFLTFVVAGPAQAAKVCIPHLTGGAANWNDYLSIDNTGLLPATITITLYDSTGTQVYSGQQTVAKLGEKVLKLKQLNANAQTGEISYTSETLIFRLSYENVYGGGVAEFLLTEDQNAVLAFLFSDFSKAIVSKGIALSNYGTLTATVQLYALGDGEVLDNTTISIPGLSKVVGTYSKWFPALEVSEVKKIIAVSSVSAMGGIVICANSDSSNLLFAPAVPLVSFAAHSSDLTGIWHGEWISDDGYSWGDIVLSMVQNSDLLTGTMDIDDTDFGDLKTVPFTGTAVDENIDIEASYNAWGYIIDIFSEGVLIDNTIIGFYYELVNGGLYDTGTFYITKE